MNRAITSSILLLLASIFMAGCGEKRPGGMPKLYPVSIIVMQEGTPLEGALVQLVSEDRANVMWGPGGTSNASGVAVLHTNGTYKGVPLGKYKVTVEKRVKESHPNPELATGGPRTPEFAKYLEISRNLKTYSYVEPQYGSVANTPLFVEITAKEKTYTIDAGKQIKTESKVLF